MHPKKILYILPENGQSAQSPHSIEYDLSALTTLAEADVN